MEQGHFQRGLENTNSVQPECKLLSYFTVNDGKKKFVEQKKA